MRNTKYLDPVQFQRRSMVNRKKVERKIGVLGGTFDPVHYGHLLIAEKARDKIKLDEILFIPAGEPVFKRGAGTSEAQHRLEMLLLATADNPYFNVSTMEIERPGPSYTVDTLLELEAGYGDKIEVYLLVGYDAIIELPSWKKPEMLVRLCYLVAVRRPGFEKFNIKLLEEEIPGVSDKIILLDEPLIDISSTDIRKMVEQGLDIKGLVPDTVTEYVSENGLYAEGSN